MLNVPSRMRTIQSLSGSENYWVNVEALELDLADLTPTELAAEEAAITALLPESLVSRMFDRAQADTSAFGPGRRSFWASHLPAPVRAAAFAA